MGGDLLAILGFIVSVAFFFWFGTTLNSINRHLGHLADHAERHTTLLASLANASPESECQGDPDEFVCDKCGADIPPDTKTCPKCGEAT